LQTLIKT